MDGMGLGESKQEGTVVSLPGVESLRISKLMPGTHPGTATFSNRLLFGIPDS